MEGIITIAFALVCMLIIPTSFETAYFLNEEDKAIMRLRAKESAAYSGGDGHFTRQDVLLALKDPKVFVSGVCQFGIITIQSGKHPICEGVKVKYLDQR